jgi:hypothetical protein
LCYTAGVNFIYSEEKMMSQDQIKITPRSETKDVQNLLKVVESRLQRSENGTIRPVACGTAAAAVVAEKYRKEGWKAVVVSDPSDRGHGYLILD